MALDHLDSHRKGDVTEAVVIAELKRRSIPVSLPFGDNERYDLVLETPAGRLLRIQVKTGRLTDGTVEFHGTSQQTNASGHVYKPYEGDVEYIVVYCHELDAMYLVGEAEFDQSLSLRVDEPAVANRLVNRAEAFEFDARWPPDRDSGDVPDRRREAVRAVFDELADTDESVARPDGDGRRRLVVEVGDDRWRSVLVKAGWITDGRIRYNHERIPKEIAYLALYVPETASLYIVPRGGFDASITLRVAPPARDDPRINWAHEYEFPTVVPW